MRNRKMKDHKSIKFAVRRYILILILTGTVLILIFNGCGEKNPEKQSSLTRQAKTLPAIDNSKITSVRGMRNLVCSDCHNALTVDTGGGKFGISFSHEKHLNRGFHCSGCHPTLKHGPGIRPGHKQCFVCHDGKKASQACSECHLKQGTLNPHPPNYVSRHGKDALGHKLDCGKCHSPDFCMNCHTLQMPHPKGWVQIHGTQITKGDCGKCHTDKYCWECHGRTKPRSHLQRNWMQAHGQAQLQFGSNCAECHNPQYCINCHKLPMPHPGNWTSAHSVVGKTQTNLCWRCHNLNQCRSCHGNQRILGHKLPFIAEHPAAARAPNPDCRVCHEKSFCARCHPSGIDGKIFPEGK